MKKLSLMEVLEGIEDSRRVASVMYPAGGNVHYAYSHNMRGNLICTNRNVRQEQGRLAA